MFVTGLCLSFYFEHVMYCLYNLDSSDWCSVHLVAVLITGSRHPGPFQEHRKRCSWVEGLPWKSNPADGHLPL